MTYGPLRIVERGLIGLLDQICKWPNGPSMSDKRIDITELEKRFQDGLNWDDMDTMDLIAELKRYYGFVDELLNYFHHTILENESFMDLMYRMGVFEFEPEPWQNEKGEWMMFVGDTYETGEWVVDKDFTPNQEE